MNVYVQIVIELSTTFLNDVYGIMPCIKFSNRINGINKLEIFEFKLEEIQSS